MVRYSVTAKNTGVTHPLIVGVSIFDASGTTFIVDMPWFVIYQEYSNTLWNVTNIGEDITLAGGTYMAKARAWEGFIPGGLGGNITYEGVRIGDIYWSGTGELTGAILDEFTRTFVVAGISADITNFQITI